VLEVVKAGGNAAILDMNRDAGEALAKEIGSAARFWECDVTDTDNIAACVAGIVSWVKETGAPLGGIVPAAGVGNPALVCSHLLKSYLSLGRPGGNLDCLLTREVNRCWINPSGPSP